MKPVNKKRHRTHSDCKGKKKEKLEEYIAIMEPYTEQEKAGAELAPKSQDATLDKILSTLNTLTTKVDRIDLNQTKADLLVSGEAGVVAKLAFCQEETGDLASDLATNRRELKDLKMR